MLPDQKLLTPCSGTAVSIGKSGRSPAVQCRMTCKLKSLFTLSLSLFPLTHKFVRPCKFFADLVCMVQAGT